MVRIFDILTPRYLVRLIFVPQDGYVLEQRVVENYPSVGNKGPRERGNKGTREQENRDQGSGVRGQGSGNRD